MFLYSQAAIATINRQSFLNKMLFRIECEATTATRQFKCNFRASLSVYKVGTLHSKSPTFTPMMHYRRGNAKL